MGFSVSRAPRFSEPLHDDRQAEHGAHFPSISWRRTVNWITTGGGRTIGLCGRTLVLPLFLGLFIGLLWGTGLGLRISHKISYPSAHRLGFRYVRSREGFSRSWIFWKCHATTCLVVELSKTRFLG
jgi:hypothetical protein